MKGLNLYEETVMLSKKACAKDIQEKLGSIIQSLDKNNKQLESDRIYEEMTHYINKNYINK